MQDLREYLIGVIVAALICGLVSVFVGDKSTVGAVVKLSSGVLLLLAVLNPWVDLRTDGLFRWADNITADGASFVTEGQLLADNYYRDSIMRQLEAYILEEAKGYDCDLTVEVILSDEDLAMPRQIRLSGDISPYARHALTVSLTEKLGLSREELIWT